MTSLTKPLNEFGGRLGGGKVLCPVTRLLSRAAKPRTGQPARNSRQCASSHPRCAMASRASRARRGSGSRPHCLRSPSQRWRIADTCRALWGRRQCTGNAVMADRPHANPALPVFPADGPKPYNGTRSPVTSFRRQRRRTAHVVSGDVDAAVGFFDNLTTGFRQSLLFRERYVCAVRANHPKFRKGMTLEAFKGSEHAMADATGMAHAVIDRFLAKHRVQRNIVLRVPGFHVLPMIVASSDLLAVIPSRLAETFVSHVPIKVLPLPIPIPPYDICIYWHERYHHDPPLRWFRRAFVKLFHAK